MAEEQRQGLQGGRSHPLQYQRHRRRAVFIVHISSTVQIGIHSPQGCCR